MDKFGFFFETKTFKQPRKVYRIEFNQLPYHQPHSKTYLEINPAVWKESSVPSFDELDITVQNDTFCSFDGTEIPLTIIQKNGSDGSKKPCLVYANGGFGDCLLPLFKPFFLLFIELFNGVVGLYKNAETPPRNYFRRPYSSTYYISLCHILLISIKSTFYSTSVDPYSRWR